MNRLKSAARREWYKAQIELQTDCITRRLLAFTACIWLLVAVLVAVPH